MSLTQRVQKRPRPSGEAFSFLDDPATRVAAVAADLRNVLIRSIPAVIAAVFLVSAYSASTSVVPAPVIVISHNVLPCSLQILLVDGEASTSDRVYFNGVIH